MVLSIFHLDIFPYLPRQNAMRLLIFLILLGSASFVSAQSAADWQQLFKGKNLKGWTVKIRGHKAGKNYNKTFRVRDGKMVVDYTKYEQFNQTYGHIFYNKPFSYYRLAVEYRFVGEQCPGGEGWAFRNSGAMLHGQSAKSMGIDQDFPISLEAQFLGGNGKDERSTANLCTPGTHVEMKGKLITDHCLNSTSPTFHGDQWVRVEMLVLGDSLLQHIVNGQVVMEYSKPVIGGGVVGGFFP
mgnify:CR=1 FL=1